ncbi:MAG: hypothetical protein SGJ11_15130, partial [Phycisphaerae bacterium]|nr:hypothetical protein [Phycisphaerae bacterium]
MRIELHALAHTNDWPIALRRVTMTVRAREEPVASNERTRIEGAHECRSENRHREFSIFTPDLWRLNDDAEALYAMHLNTLRTADRG